MKITEKKLLDNYNGVANDGDFISVIKGVNYYWHYTEYHYDNDKCEWVIDRDKSDIRYQTYDTVYTEIICPAERCMNRKMFERVEKRFDREMKELMGY